MGCGRRYAEVQSGASYHVKASMVRQAARSSYTCNEAAMGAAISRHDLYIQQVSSDMQISSIQARDAHDVEKAMTCPYNRSVLICNFLSIQARDAHDVEKADVVCTSCKQS